MQVTIPYTPRKAQAYIHENLDKFRYSLLCCHRRFGKTVLCINHLIKAAMTSKNHQPRYAYIAPTYSQAKKIAYDYLVHFTKNIPGMKYNQTELRADFINGARITLLSSENPDSLRGIYLDGCIIDETAQINSELINEVITPALSDRKGFMCLVGTPKGMANLFYDYYQKAQGDPTWFLHVAKASQTKIVDQDELAAALAVMGPQKYEQEFECSFIGNIQGSIYGEAIASLEDKKQITRVPIDPSYPVNVAWDLGYNDATSLIFFQQIGHMIHIVDCYENTNEPLPHYAQVIKEKDYIIGQNYGPHDLEQTEFGSGKTRREVAYQMGLRFKVAPRMAIEDGIHAVKMLLPRCLIDVDHCTKLINALRHYHRKFSDKERTYKIKPVHDWSSHFCDSLRTLATGITENKFNQNKRQQVADTNYKVL
nr:phage terminase large subunit [uncultured Mediterranean phage uvMED]